MIGRTFAHYQITEMIGEGGMGEVYRATDTRLNRDVALKVLPESFAQDLQRMARFTREAQFLASLNHPNIGAIHGLEEEDGVRALVLELIPGDNLAERIAQGPIPLEEALRIALQIAEALESAHEKRVIHRDLKPANVKVTPEGQVKVLDFGLAKALDGEGARDDIANSPTLSIQATQPGIILGTAGYMAPEQARGRPVDHRADLWALGVILFEMLTGEQIFRGQTVADSLAKVLEREPDWSLLPAQTPRTIRALLERCLAKDVRMRIQSAGDARLRIWEYLDNPTRWAESSSATASLRTKWLVAILAVLLPVGFFFGRLTSPPPDSGAISTRLRLSIQPAEELGDVQLIDPFAFSEQARLTRQSMAFSPDGKTLVFVGRREGRQMLFSRPLNRYQARPLPETDGAFNPFFSPDGRRIAFWANGQIKKIPAAGGPSTVICEWKRPMFGAAWTPENSILFADFEGGLLQVPASGGSPGPFTTLEEGEAGHRLPALLPKGRGVLFTVRQTALPGKWETARVVLFSPETGTRRVLIEGGADARYSQTGHLLYARMGNLMAVPFDLDRLEVTGDPVVLIDGIAQAVNNATIWNDSGSAQFAVSSLGTLAYIPGGIYPETKRKLVWVDRQGKVTPLEAPRRSYWTPRLSPDGKRIAFHAYTNGFAQIWLYDIPRGTLTLLTRDASASPVWTTDGSKVVFAGANLRSLEWLEADGSGTTETLFEHSALVWPGRMSPTGKLPFSTDPINQDADLWVLDLADRPQATPILETRANEQQPTFSPDGRWLAYVSDATGRDEVYARLYPGPGPVVQLSANGGQEPVWSQSGKELFYRSLAPPKMMRVAVETEQNLVASKPRSLFDDVYVRSTPGSYDVASDGRFLMVLPEPKEESSAPHQIHIVVNWLDELQALAAGQD